MYKPTPAILILQKGEEKKNVEKTDGEKEGGNELSLSPEEITALKAENEDLIRRINVKESEYDETANECMCIQSDIFLPTVISIFTLCL